MMVMCLFQLLEYTEQLVNVTK